MYKTALSAISTNLDIYVKICCFRSAVDVSCIVLCYRDVKKQRPLHLNNNEPKTLQTDLFYYFIVQLYSTIISYACQNIVVGTLYDQVFPIQSTCTFFS